MVAFVALWIWAGTQDALPRTIGWAQQWLNQQPPDAGMGQLSAEGVQGSLLSGGNIASLHWSGQGMDVRAEGVTLTWNRSIWWELLTGQGVHVAELKARSLLIHDGRPPSDEPARPLQSLTLPMPVGVVFDLEELSYTGQRQLEFAGIRGRYAFGTPTGAGASPLTHRLQVDQVEFAEGSYQALLTLGGNAPMPLTAELQARISTVVPDGAPVAVTLSASANGTLAGDDATLELQFQGNGTARSPEAEASEFTGTAVIRPWAPQPIAEANVQLKAVDLSAYRADAPATDLYGQLKVQSLAEAWRLSLDVDNRRAGPLDQNAIPVQSVLAEVMQDASGWTVQSLEAQAAGGSIEGQGHLSTRNVEGTTTIEAWQGNIKALQIKPSEIWSPLAKGALNGQLTAQAAPGPDAPDAIAVKASILPASRQPEGSELGGFQLKQLSLDARWAPGAASWEIKKARLDAAGAVLEADGVMSVDLARYQVNAKLATPGSNLRLDGLFSHGSGKGNMAWKVNDARRWMIWLKGLQKLPVIGSSVATALSGQEDVELEGSLSSQWAWQGGLGALGFPAPAENTPAPAWPTLNGSLEVPKLVIQSKAAGAAGSSKLEALRVQARGPLNNLTFDIQGAAANATWRTKLETGGTIQLAPTGPGEGRLRARTLSLELTQPAGEPDGRRHDQQWQLASAQPLEVTWRQSAQGKPSIDAGAGQFTFSPTGRSAPGLSEPLHLSWQSLIWAGDALETKGRLEGLSYQWIEHLASLDGQTAPTQPGEHATISGDLIFDGEWDVRIPTDTQVPMRLSASLQRRSGDLRWTGGAHPAGTANSSAPVVAGVKDGRLSLTLRDKLLSANLTWDTERLGTAKASFETRLNPVSGVASSDESLLDRWWPASTPIQGYANAQLPQIGVWSMLAPPGWRVRGSLSADATLSGTRARPSWRGNIQAKDLSLRSVVDGFAFTNGELLANIAGDRIEVTRFTLQGPGGASQGGTLEASGVAEWRAAPETGERQAHISLQASARRLRVSTRVDRRLVISGDMTAQLEQAILKLRGQIKADTATFVLPDESAPSLSKDVVIRITGSAPINTAGAQTVKPDVDMKLDLGNDFNVRGRGVETLLEGTVSVRATPSAPTPRAHGEVRTASGTYRAYGQQLNIETGVLRFTGPYDDPALDIIAVRKLPENTEQRVGVHITGNAQSPRVDLFSEPDLPVGDKLAWLVLGRPASSAGAQAFVLQQAARKLLTRGGQPMDNELAKTLGIDEITFGTSESSTEGTAGEAAVMFGKRLSNRLYLSYEQSLAGAMSTVSILYDLSRSLTLRARAGTENAVDVIFTHQYE
ncbi:translocation/assembly module TamB domain-containing protein [Hydrogenophaga sp. 5NK40-0174]